MAPPTLETLPGEIFLHILSYLEPTQAAKLQLVSKQLRGNGRDNGFWRSESFQESTYLESLLRHRRIFGRPDERGSTGLLTTWPSSITNSSSGSGSDSGSGGVSFSASRGTDRSYSASQQQHDRERVRIMANWDPVFPGERVSWYDEYIQRNAPIAVNWFQVPHHENRVSRSSSSSSSNAIEVRGMALYWPDAASCSADDDDVGATAQTLLAVAPLEDGSVCLWDVNGTLRKRGAIVSRSAPGILFGGREPFEFGVTECVSVDSRRHLAFFSIENYLVEVDLQRLSVVGQERFQWPITALSTAHHSVPLTVGMSRGIHMHDSRARAFAAADGHGSAYQRHCAPHPQPGPLSILHLQEPGSEEAISDDIYVAGRIPSILHYDRRNLSTVKDTIHSGASLCSMTSLPYPFSVLDSDLRRDGLLSVGQVEKSKAALGGRTIVACGEYKSKGSLEIYGIGPAPNTASLPAAEAGGGGGRGKNSNVVEYQQNSAYKNRQTSSFSKIFSVANHGTRLVVSDGAGFVKWFERDGFTEVRRWRLGDDGEDVEAEATASLFDSTTESGDIARKLLPTRVVADTGGAGRWQRSSSSSLKNNDVLFWTGEKIGSLRFSSKPGFQSEDFEEAVKTAQERAAEAEERRYNAKMRQLLEKQANDVRFVRHLGLGSGRRG